jgi:hypothetical protein
MTIQRSALINPAGVVVNVHIEDTEAGYVPAEGLTNVACPDEVYPGFTYVAGAWTAPPEEVTDAPAAEG